MECGAGERILKMARGMRHLGFVTANILLVVLSFLYEGLVSYRARLDTRLAARNSM